MSIESTSTNLTSSTSGTTNPSTISQITGNINVTNTPEYLALMEKYRDELQKPQTPAQIKATAQVTLAVAEAKRISGEVRNKFTVLIIIGTIIFLLASFGCYVFIKSPEISKDVWVIIGPIITAGLSGTVGFLTGEKQGANKE